MSYLIKTGRAFFAVALIVYGIQHFYFGTFRNVFFSAYQEYLPLLNIFSYIFGLYLVLSGGLILAGKKGRETALLLGAVLLILFLCTQIPYELISQPYKGYLALWVNPLKEFALSGCAFVVAGSFQDDRPSRGVYRFLGRLAPYGNLFFLFTMICFGIGHLQHGRRLSDIVPAWWPDHLFWVHFTGVALVGAGVSIMLGIRIRVISLLLALMIFLWFWMVHIPAGIKHPVFERGNLLASAFDALAFSGISILMAFTMEKQRWINKIENL
jgi:uncharacterized membrane protein